MQQSNMIVQKWAAVEGDRFSSMLKGVVHTYCDSNIWSDAFSVNDAERVAAAGLWEANEDDVIVAAECGLEAINDAVIAHDGGPELDCIQCASEIFDIYGSIEEFELQVSIDE